MTTDVLLIGGGVASASAASELRAQGFAGSITLLTRELQPPYHRPPVTKELLTGRAEGDDVLVHPAEWYVDHDIELRTRAGVTALDPEARQVKLATKEEITFDQALIATGAMVRRLQVDGAQLEGIHYLRAPGNAAALRKDLEDAQHAVVVGGSFVATEVAASLIAAGTRCTLVMQEARPLERAFGGFVGGIVAEHLERRGVAIIGGEDVVTMEGDERVTGVVTASRRRIAGDVVVVGAGAVPDAGLAARAGLDIGETGGIRCDAHLATSAAGIYAAGDVCEYDSVVHGRRIRVEHEEHAAAQGRTAARNMLGQAVEHREVPYFWTDLADWLTLEYVGAAARWDAEVVSGDPAGRFTVWYLDGDRVVAALTAGRSADLDVARELIATAATAASLAERGIDAAPAAVGVAR
jgi:3-phenylpropionate/trans-cinnamate dioxygenase ferredoxin reductase subunit